MNSKSIITSFVFAICTRKKTKKKMKLAVLYTNIMVVCAQMYMQCVWVWWVAYENDLGCRLGKVECCAVGIPSPHKYIFKQNKLILFCFSCSGWWSLVVYRCCGFPLCVWVCMCMWVIHVSADDILLKTPSLLQKESILHVFFGSFNDDVGVTQQLVLYSFYFFL